MKARVKTAEKITGVKGMKDFGLDNGIQYPAHLNTQGIIEVEKANSISVYDFQGKNNRFSNQYLADWLEFLPEPDLEMDAKVLVWDRDGIKRRRYFAGKFREGCIGCWNEGQTSWSVNNSIITYWGNWEILE